MISVAIAEPLRLRRQQGRPGTRTVFVRRHCALAKGRRGDGSGTSAGRPVLERGWRRPMRSAAHTTRSENHAMHVSLPTEGFAAVDTG